MSIPNDPENRFWLELSGNNPNLVAEFKPCLIGFLGFDHSRLPSLAGTGFLIAGDSDFAIAITAKHVVAEGMLNIQRPIPRHVPSALFVPESSKKPALSEETYRAVWMGSESADVLYTRHLSYHDNLDVACCIVEPQEEYKNHFKPVSIPLDTYRPAIGEVIHMVSQVEMKIEDRHPPTGLKGVGQRFSIHRKLSIRRGVVTGIYPNGFRQYPWQCFTTSIPAEPGMSGGFVYVPRNGQTVSACGIICADNSAEAARSNFSICGESVIACAWTTLALRMPEYYSNDSPMITLFSLMQKGMIPSAVGGIDHIEVIDNGDDSGSIKRLW